MVTTTTTYYVLLHVLEERETKVDPTHRATTADARIA
jgi:hypothetical protein